MELIRLTARLVLFTGFMGLTATLAGTLLLVETLFRCQIDRAPFARICFNGASRCLGFRMSTQGQGDGGVRQRPNGASPAHNWTHYSNCRRIF